MSYKTVKATCRSCSGLGWYESSEWQTDRGWSDYYTNRYYGCSSCGGSGNEMEIDKIKKGSGKENVKIKTLGGTCSVCDGTGKTTSRWREEGTDSKGREYRKDFDRTDSCSSCFGTGEKCAEVSSKTCDKCNGGGGFYYWEKSSFSSTEYKKERKCEHCNGSGRIENLEGYWASSMASSSSADNTYSQKTSVDAISSVDVNSASSRNSNLFESTHSKKSTTNSPNTTGITQVYFDDHPIINHLLLYVGLPLMALLLLGGIFFGVFWLAQKYGYGWLYLYCILCGVGTIWGFEPQNRSLKEVSSALLFSFFGSAMMSAAIFSFLCPLVYVLLKIIS